LADRASRGPPLGPPARTSVGACRSDRAWFLHAHRWTIASRPRAVRDGTVRRGGRVSADGSTPTGRHVRRRRRACWLLHGARVATRGNGRKGGRLRAVLAHAGRAAEESVAQSL